MAYIGNTVGERFVASQPASVYSGDGSTTVFTLEHSVASDEDILVSVDGVVQEPSVAYAVSGGTTLTFTSAPSNNTGNNIFVYYLFRTVATVDHPSTSSLLATDGTFSGDLTVDTTTLHVDSTNNRVGVGTVTPDYNLQIEDDSTSVNLSLRSDSASNSRIYFGDSDSATIGAIVYRNGNNSMAFETNGSEGFRLDDSDNLLVGKTSSSITSNGFELRGNNGASTFTRDGATVSYFVRNTDDGDLLEFRKDTTVVGTIKTNNGNRTILSLGGNNNAGITGATSANQILPTLAGSTDNGTVDLGASSVRWKNLYLSGGVYLGGTASANLLHDYEEGTWTPGFTTNNGSSASATVSQPFYTRIGRVVYIHARLSNIVTTGTTSTSELRVNGLPYTIDSAITYGSVVHDNVTCQGARTQIVAEFNTNEYIRFMQNGSGSSETPTDHANINSGQTDIFFAGFYITSQ